MERTYRTHVKAKGLVSFQVMVKETDLWISADRDLTNETRDLVFKYRYQIEQYIQSYPVFLTTLEPYPYDPFAPALIRDMIDGTRRAGVGPMASVAGALAQFIGRDLLETTTNEVIIENGGDIFIKTCHPITISILAGQSPLSTKIGLKIQNAQMPMGVCSSSGTVGHSLSFGRADVVCVLSSSTTLADAAATALGNRLKQKTDLEFLRHWAKEIEGVIGVVAVMEDKMAVWGQVELVDL